MLFVGTSIIHPSTEGVFLLCNILDLLIYSRKESFDLGEFNLYMGGGFNEVGDRIFLTQFTPENGQNNTELWELSHTSGKLERVATWYNPNAEAAAQEP